MSDSLLSEYKNLYNVRTKRYEGNENYKHSYQAEKNLSEAMNSCNTLEEFKDKIGNLNEECTKALVKDEHILEKKFFEKHRETVRVKISEQVLEKVDNCKDSIDIATMVTEISNKISIEISMDESHRQFISEWNNLDLIQIYQNAIVPDQYKSYMNSSVQDFKDSLIKSVAFLENNNNEWESNWKPKPDLNLEHRHRRLIPYKDEDVRSQLALYKSIINR